MAEPLISVCVCTFKRSHVEATIGSIVRQQLPDALSFEVVVADDDPERSAADLVAKAAAAATQCVRYIHSGACNIASARNACLDAARGAWIAFIDDDEIAASDWLARLMAVAHSCDADIVKGAVVARYPTNTPRWIISADPFSRDYGGDGEMPKRLATGNVLVRRRWIEKGELRFDSAFGQGGEDTEFFHRLLKSAPQVKVAAARSAIVYEIVQEDRVGAHYLSARYRAQGRVSGLRLRRGSHERPAPLALVEALAAIALFWWHPFVRGINPHFALQLMNKFYYSAGLLEGRFNRPRPDAV